MSYHSKITSKGQITLPVELREKFDLHAGDTIEFFLDHRGEIGVRVRRQGLKAFLDALPPRKRDPAYPTDDEAIAAEVVSRDRRSRSRKART